MKKQEQPLSIVIVLWVQLFFALALTPVTENQWGMLRGRVFGDPPDLSALLSPSVLFSITVPPLLVALTIFALLGRRWAMGASVIFQSLICVAAGLFTVPLLLAMFRGRPMDLAGLSIFFCSAPVVFVSFVFAVLLGRYFSKTHADEKA